MPQMSQLRGAKMLKVVGVLMIVLGAITSGGGIITYASTSVMSGTLGLGEFGEQYFRMIGVIALVSGLVMLVVGVIGIKNRNKAEQAGLLLICGIILIVVTVFTNLYQKVIAPMGQQINEQIINSLQDYGGRGNAVDYSGLSGNVFLNTIGYILPILFIVCAVLNRLPPKAAGAPYMQEPQVVPYLQSGVNQELDTEPQDDTPFAGK